MADEVLPRGAQLRQSYEKNPLFQQESNTLFRGSPFTVQSEVKNGYVLPSSNPTGNATPFGQRPEDALGPFLESLRLAQGDPMYKAISAQMDNLYQVFKELHDQDQAEIRKLLLALEAHKQQLSKLATDNSNMQQQLRMQERELSSSAAVQLPWDPQPLSRPGLQQSAQRQQQQQTVGLLHAHKEALGSEADKRASNGSEGGSQGIMAMQRGGGAGAGGSGSERDIRAVAAAGASASSSGGRAQAIMSNRHGGGGRRPYLILFLPYWLHPAHHCWSFYAAWQHSWTSRRTLWLAVAWLLMFLLAVGLLVGLLVPWDRLSRTTFPFSPGVVDSGPSHVSVVVQLNRPAILFYIVVPEAFTVGAAAAGRRLLTEANSGYLHKEDAATRYTTTPTGSARGDPGDSSGRWQLVPPRLPLGYFHGHHRGLLVDSSGAHAALELSDVKGSDVRDIAEGSVGQGHELFPFAVACGIVDMNQGHTNYTLTVRNGVSLVSSRSQAGAGAGANSTTSVPVDECSTSFGMDLNMTLPEDALGPFFMRRCLRCPLLQPGTPYVALLVGDGGRSTGVVQVRFSTAQVARSSPLGEASPAVTAPAG